MLSSQTPGIGTLDANLGRVIEETISVVNDVESRLQALKIGISQALPQLAPVLLWREQALAAIAARQFANPHASVYGVPTIPFTPFSGLPPTFSPMGVPTAFTPTPGLFGATGYGTPTTPMFASPFGASFASPFTPTFGTNLPPGFTVNPSSPQVFGPSVAVTNPFGIVTPFRIL